AIGVGEQSAKIWADSHPFITGLAVPALMTAAILILSEIIPKTIGATNWKSFAPFTIHSLKVLLVVMEPLVWVCQLITGLFNTTKGKSVFSRIDFLAMAQIGSEEGHLDQSESKLIHNLIHFKKFKIRDIMTPRTVVASAVQTMTARDFYDLQ